MDIATTLAKNSTSSKWSKMKWVLGGLLFVSLFALAYIPINNIPSMKLADLALSTVKRGDLDLVVKGYGQLKAKQQQYLTSRFQATVAQIFHYPGEKVQADTVVMSLFNPQLELQLADAELAVAQQKARLDEQVIEQKSQLLERESALTQMRSDLENARLRVEAEDVLAAEGIVSKLEYKRSQLLVSQLEQRVKIEMIRLDQLEQIHQQRSKIQQDLYQQYVLRLANATAQLAQLQVQAGIDGVLQTMDVEVGQTVSAGALLAQVGSDRQLKAQLRVQQREAETVSLGMQGSINTFGGEATGIVTRIDPIIVDGRVLVELELTGELPKNARPELSVDGKIFTGSLQDVLYVSQPTNTSPNKAYQVYAINHEQTKGHKQAVEFGYVSDSKIQIIKGLAVGEVVITSDMSHMYKHQYIHLTQ